MSFSAAQARALMITALMNDITHEVFSINTARTQLSQRANILGEQMAELALAVPPSVNDYTTINYSFVIGTDTVTIDYVRPNNETYNVAIRRTQIGHYMDDVGPYRVRMVDGAYYVGDTQLQLFGAAGIPDSETTKYLEAIRNTFPDYADAGDDEILNAFFVYPEQNRTGRMAYHFMKRTDLGNLSPETQTADIPTYDYIANGSYTVVETLEECLLEFDSAGRITEISVPTTTDDDVIRYTRYPVSASTTTDQEAYEDAYAKYQYSKYKYDQEYSALEQQIAKIQRDEKLLELKLQKLENEYSARKTEYDSVKKVIDDNIEKSFNTFG